LGGLFYWVVYFIGWFILLGVMGAAPPILGGVTPPQTPRPLGSRHYSLFNVHFIGKYLIFTIICSPAVDAMAISNWISCIAFICFITWPTNRKSCNTLYQGRKVKNQTDFSNKTKCPATQTGERNRGYKIRQEEEENYKRRTSQTKPNVLQHRLVRETEDIKSGRKRRKTTRDGLLKQNQIIFFPK